MAEAQVARCEAVFEVGSSPIRLVLEATDEGLRRCKLVAEPYDTARQQAPSHPVLEQAVRELREYFMGERAKFEVTLAPEGTDFQLQVWKATRQDPLWANAFLLVGCGADGQSLRNASGGGGPG